MTQGYLSLLLTTLIALLSGCASTPSEVRKPENLAFDIEVDLNYRVIHKKLYECFDSQYSGQTSLATYGILQRIYPERGASELSHYMDGGYGRLVSTTTDLIRLTENRTRVQTYLHFNSWYRLGLDMQTFLRNRPLDCSYITFSVR